MCWRTCFLRRMESLEKGTHYNICACARKETTEGWKKTRRYGRALHDTRVLTCLTSGSRHVRHPGVGHKIKANGRNDTGRKQYRNMQRKERQKEKVNTMFKEYFYSLFLCSRPIIHFLNSTFHLFTLIIHLLPTLYTINSITLSISLDSFCTMEPSYNLPG